MKYGYGAAAVLLVATMLPARAATPADGARAAAETFAASLRDQDLDRALQLFSRAARLRLKTAIDAHTDQSQLTLRLGRLMENVEMSGEVRTAAVMVNATVVLSVGGRPLVLVMVWEDDRWKVARGPALEDFWRLLESGTPIGATRRLLEALERRDVDAVLKLMAGADREQARKLDDAQAEAVRRRLDDIARRFLPYQSPHLQMTLASQGDDTAAVLLRVPGHDEDAVAWLVREADRWVVTSYEFGENVLAQVAAREEFAGAATPQEAVQRLFRALAEGNEAELLPLLTTARRQRWLRERAANPAAHRRRRQAALDAVGQYLDEHAPEIESLVMRRDRASADVKLGQHAASVELMREEDEWRVVEFAMKANADKAQAEDGDDPQQKDEGANP